MKPVVKAKYVAGLRYWVVYLDNQVEEAYWNWPEAIENALTLVERKSREFPNCLYA